MSSLSILRRRRAMTRGLHMLFLVSSVIAIAAALAVAETAQAGDGTTARDLNARTIQARAWKLMPEDINRGYFVDVAEWAAYLRLAFMPHMDPEKRGYLPTHVRCYWDRAWQAAVGKHGIIGFYRGGSWVHVRHTTCVNAAKAALGEVSTTNVVALATIMHEGFHRQGIKREVDAACLGAVGVYDATWRAYGEALATTAWNRVMAWYEDNFEGAYKRGLRACANRAEAAWNDSSAWR
jgi:hypothetical protein